MPRSRRDRPPSWGEWPPPSKPLPADGISARSRRGAIGESWWSQRFVAVLESYGLGGRMERGRRYARQGQVLALAVHAGRVSATVQGSRPSPYRVEIIVPVYAPAAWEAVCDVLASRAAYAARLLAGEMPHDIDDAVALAGVAPLFPARWSDLRAACSCPDWGNPCKHVAAVLYLLAETFDDDPFLVLAWRGRGRDELLTALRQWRGAPGVGAPVAVGWWDTVVAGLEEPPPLADSIEQFWTAGPGLDEPHRSPTPPPSPDAVLRRLAPLDLSVRGRPVPELLRPLYERLTSVFHHVG